MLNKFQPGTQRDFYDAVNPAYLQYRKNIPYARYIVGKVLPYLGRKPARVLEIGAGQGRFTFELASHVGHLTATDISPGEILLLKKHAEKTGVKNIASGVMDVVSAGKKQVPHAFDHIVGFFILHHLPKDKLNVAVQNLAPKLKPGGRMAFVENNPTSPWHLLAIMLRRDMTWEIEKGTYTDYIGVFLRECRRRGMKVIRCHKTGFFPPEFINRWPGLAALDRFIQRIPLIRDIFCPFIVVALEKGT